MAKDVYIGDIIEDPEVVEALSKEKVEEKRQKDKYQKPVPMELQIYHLPEDINDYITKIYPNMRTWISFKIQERHNIDEVINNYIIYILGFDKKNQLRWTKYDPIRFPNQPYHKWFLRQLYFYVLHYRNQQHRDSYNTSLSENSFEDSVENYGSHTMNIDLLSRGDKSQDQSEEVTVAEFEQQLQDFSSKYPVDAFLCFEAYAYRLYQAKQDGVSNKALAERWGISPSAVSQWMNKLKGLTTSFLDGGQIDFA